MGRVGGGVGGGVGGVGGDVGGCVGGGVGGSVVGGGVGTPGIGCWHRLTSLPSTAWHIFCAAVVAST